MRILIFATLLITSSLIANNTKINLHAKPDELKRSILNVIKIGSDINKAKKIMESNGFNCSFKKNSTFSDGKNLYRHIDFLYCDIEKGFLVSRRWQTAVLHKNNIVENVVVSTGLTGP